MASPSRRAVLSALATVPVTGCLDMVGPTTPQTTPTDLPGSTTTPTPDDKTPTPTPDTSGPVRRQPGDAYEANELSVTVSDMTVRHGMVAFEGVHPDPKWVKGAQFLLATLTVEGDQDPANLDVTATANTLDGRPDRYFGFAPDAPDSVQPVGFVVPTDTDISEAAVVWNGPREVQWPLPEDLVANLASAPDFVLKELRVPETASEGMDIDVELDVANTGDRDGRFLAELGNGAISDQPEIEVTVPASETVTTSRSMEAQFFDGAMDVVCRWEGGVQRRSVQPA